MPQSASATVPEAATLQREGRSLLERGKALVIKTTEDFRRAGAELLEVARFKKTVSEKFAPAKKAANEAHRTICQLETDVLKPAVEVERILRAGLSAYSIEQERLRRETQARLEREERERRETEAIAIAEDLENRGEDETAEAVLAAEIAAPPVVFELPQERAQGISTRKTWKYRVVDEKKVNRTYLMLDEKKIGQQVRALGPEAAALVGGIQVYEEANVVARTA